MAIAAALDVNVPSLVDWIARAYNVREADLVKTFQRLSAEPDGPYVVNKAAGTLNHKIHNGRCADGIDPDQRAWFSDRNADAGDRYVNKDGKINDGTDVYG